MLATLETYGASPMPITQARFIAIVKCARDYANALEKLVDSFHRLKDAKDRGEADLAGLIDHYAYINTTPMLLFSSYDTPVVLKMEEQWMNRYSRQNDKRRERQAQRKARVELGLVQPRPSDSMRLHTDPLHEELGRLQAAPATPSNPEVEAAIREAWEKRRQDVKRFDGVDLPPDPPAAPGARFKEHERLGREADEKYAAAREERRKAMGLPPLTPPPEPDPNTLPTPEPEPPPRPTRFTVEDEVRFLRERAEARKAKPETNQ